MSDMANYQAPLLAGGPHWLTLSFVLIGLGVLVALVILFWGARLANRRRQVREELQERGELVEVPAYSAPPVTPSPPPLADSPTPATVPEPEPLADEPIVAAAPLDAAPATLAASEPPLGVPAAGDELTRMKGVGPRLADRLNAKDHHVPLAAEHLALCGGMALHLGGRARHAQVLSRQGEAGAVLEGDVENPLVRGQAQFGRPEVLVLVLGRVHGSHRCGNRGLRSQGALAQGRSRHHIWHNGR